MRLEQQRWEVPKKGNSRISMKRCVSLAYNNRQVTQPSKLVIFEILVFALFTFYETISSHL